MMQSLSHYSYHISSGMFTLCDLQGGLADMVPSLPILLYTLETGDSASLILEKKGFHRSFVTISTMSTARVVGRNLDTPVNTLL